MEADVLIKELNAERNRLLETDRKLDLEISLAEKAQMSGDPDRVRLTAHIAELYQQRTSTSYALGRVEQRLEDAMALQVEQSERTKAVDAAWERENSSQDRVDERSDRYRKFLEEKKKKATEKDLGRDIELEP